jgi:hypothetical protein
MRHCYEEMWGPFGGSGQRAESQQWVEGRGGWREGCRYRYDVLQGAVVRCHSLLHSLSDGTVHTSFTFTPQNTFEGSTRV